MSILFYAFAKMAVLITHMIVNNLIIEALHSRDHYVILIYVRHVGVQLRVGQCACLYVFRLISHKIYLVNFEHFPDSARPCHFYRSAQARCFCA